MDQKKNEINLYPSFDTKVEFLRVEYPGIVCNVNSVLATLGGQEHLQNVYRNPNKRLDLKFRPDDPCCKPLCGDRTPCTSLLLRVCKYQRQKKLKDDDNNENEFMYRQHICGIITTTYKFKSLCDYQYLPLKRDAESGKMQSMILHLKVDESTLQDKSFFTRDVPLFLPPPIFGRIDKPYSYQYKKEHYSYKKKTGRNTDWDSNVSVRKDRAHQYCMLVHYEAKAPEKCSPKAQEMYNKMYETVKEAAEKVKQAFEERPVWSRNALQGTVGIALPTLKVILPAIAYYIVSGPWARLWARFGYDPKLDPAAKAYQLIDFRLRQGIYTPHIPIKAKRSTFKYRMPRLTSNRSNKTLAPFLSNQPSEKHEDKTSPPDTAYVYQPGVLPAHRQIYYQVCDIKLPKVQELVERVASDASTACTKEEGWFVPNTTAEIRNVLSKDIFRTLTAMKDGSPREAPKDLFSSFETKPPSDGSSSIPSEELDQEESDPDEDSGSSETSDDEDSIAERSQEDILVEAFSFDADEEELPDDEEFEEDFFFDDDQMDDDSAAFDKPGPSKE